MFVPPPSSYAVKEVNSQLSSIMRDIHLVGTPAMSEIDKELMPLVKTLVSRVVYYGRQQHPEVKDLFNWFMHPQRTMEEFYYVLGPLANHVNHIIIGGNMISVGAAALEFLAVKCPVLEGPWEIMMWLIMRLIYSSAPESFQPSKCLSKWVVYMVGDADICPNAYLRLELIFLLKMVKFNDTHPRQILEAMMRACSNLNSDYLERNYYNKNYGHCSALRFKSIAKRIRRIEYPLPNGILEFGERLAIKLKDVNSSRLSSTMYDITNSHGLNPNNYNEPWELQTLVALLNTTGGYAHAKYDRWFDEFSGDSSDDCTMYMCKILIRKFKPCYSMPQLIYPTASFLINVMEFAIGVLGNPTWDDERQMPNEIDTSNVIIMDKLLQELLTDNGSFTLEKSAIWREVIFRYRARLKILKERFGPFYEYPTIFTLMEHV